MIISSLNSFLGISLITSRIGNHLLNSLFQLLTTELGHTIKYGPLIFLNWTRYANKAIVYIVLPRPISSAKIPLKPILFIDINQFNATN